MIDWTRVTELRNEIGEESFDEVVDLFLDEVEQEIAVLRAGCEAAQLESRMHLLKGSALNLGFGAFAEKCHRGETAAANGQYAQIDMPATLSCFDESKRTFLSGLKNRAG